MNQYLATRAEDEKAQTKEAAEGIQRIEKALGVELQMASCMWAAHPKSDEMMQISFENGSLPCSFSLLWKPVIARLQQVEEKQESGKLAVIEEQQKKEEARLGVEKTQEEILNLQDRLARFKEEEQIHSDTEKLLQAELEEFELLGIAALRRFVLSAAQIEEKLVSQMEVQLEQGRENLLALKEEGGPKLGLLLNCFGADLETIQTFSALRSKELANLSREEVKYFAAKLPKEQQIVVLYTRNRLLLGQVPFGEHDCALCHSKTPEEMAAFLNERQIKISVEVIRKTGAFGLGALLFISAHELELLPGTADFRAWIDCLAEHRHPNAPN